MTSAGFSVPVTYDTIYGISWFPDGKLIGLPPRQWCALKAEDGEQVLFNGVHG